MSRVELYKFSTNTTEYLLTSANTEQVHLGETYVPATLGRGDIEVKNEIAKSANTVTIDIFHELAQAVLSDFSNNTMALSIFVKTDSVVGVAWKGRLANTIPEGTILKMSFENIFTALNRPGLGQRWQKPCRHNVYRRGCNLNREDFAVLGEIDSFTGKTVTIAAAATQPDGHFFLGMLEVSGQLGFIVEHVGNTIVLQHPMKQLEESQGATGYGEGFGQFYGGLSVKLYPGCDKLISTCKNKFNNLDNNGSHPFIPSRSPMDGSSIV